MKSLLSILAGAVFVFVASVTASFGDIIYNLNDALTANVTLTGFIKTDGTFGSLDDPNIVSFDIAVSGPGGTSHVTSANNTVANIIGGIALTANQNGLFFNFTSGGLFDVASSDTGVFMCADSSSFCSPVLSWNAVGTGGSAFTSAPFANIEFAVVATPLPAALPLFATGLGALGLLGWRRKRKNVAI